MATYKAHFKMFCYFSVDGMHSANDLRVMFTNSLIDFYYVYLWFQRPFLNQIIIFFQVVF